ncbi:MAG: hypothetical protein WDN09_04080 [bacterium]
MKISTFFFGTAIIVFSSFIASCGDSEATMAMRAKQIAEDSIAKAAAALAQAKADSAAKAEAAITELVPETISVTEVTSTKSSKEEFNNEGLAEVKASFGIHIIAAGKAYDVQVENEDMNHEGGSIEKYEDMDKPIAETHKLRAGHPFQECHELYPVNQRQERS